MFFDRIPCPDTEQLAASVGGSCQSYLPRPVELLSTGRQLSSKPLGDRSDQSNQPFWHGVRGRSGRSLSKAHWSRRRLRCTHNMYILTRQVFLGRCNEVWFHRFPSTSFGFPFHHFPLHTLLFLLLSFMSFMSCHLTPFFLLRAHQSGP